MWPARRERATLKVMGPVDATSATMASKRSTMTSVDTFLGLTSLGAKPDMEQVNNAIKMDDPYEKGPAAIERQKGPQARTHHPPGDHRPHAPPRPLSHSHFAPSPIKTFVAQFKFLARQKKPPVRCLLFCEAHLISALPVGSLPAGDCSKPNRHLPSVAVCPWGTPPDLGSRGR